VYIYDIAKTTSIRITADGGRETVHNGLIEWIYECKKYFIDLNLNYFKKI